MTGANTGNVDQEIKWHCTNFSQTLHLSNTCSYTLACDAKVKFRLSIIDWPLTQGTSAVSGVWLTWFSRSTKEKHGKW